MNISIILAHPYAQSFNHGLAQTLHEALVKAGHTVRFHDLQAEHFDPVMTVEELGTDQSTDPLVIQHQQELMTSDGIIAIHPNWWGQPPAILKGWIDRVLRQGVAYTFGLLPNGKHGPQGLLPVKTLLVFTTSNTPNEVEDQVLHNPLQSIWTQYVAGFCCFPTVKRTNFSVVVSSTPEVRQAWLAEARKTALELFPAQVQNGSFGMDCA